MKSPEAGTRYAPTVNAQILVNKFAPPSQRYPLNASLQLIICNKVYTYEPFHIS